MAKKMPMNQSFFCLAVLTQENVKRESLADKMNPKA